MLSFVRREGTFVTILITILGTAPNAFNQDSDPMLIDTS